MNKLSHSIANALISSYQDFADRVHALSDGLSEEQFWTKPYPYGNSFGHLTLHLIGNLNYFIGTEIAKSGYVRDREREFREPNPPKKAEVLKSLDHAVELVVATLEAQTPDTWTNEYEATDAADFVKDRFSVFLRCASHFHHHLGQMVYLEKELARQSAGHEHRP